ncbi:MAG: type II secretion system F family protein [Steroidobacteraceae bacterium]
MGIPLVVGFLVAVFAAVLLLMLGLTTSASSEARTRRVLRRRLERIGADAHQDIASILREKYLTSLSPLERRLEELPFMSKLAELSEQAGRDTPAYRMVMTSLLLGLFAGLTSWALLHNALIGLIGATVGFAAPYMQLSMQRRRRLDKIEEQLPDAIDVIKRALRAGHPFNAAIKLVAEDMDQPIAREFELTFSDLNYGNDVRRAMLGLLTRVPSVTVMALITSVLVQRETGGNLAEILDQIAKIVRSRFRFERKVRSLSAEGRMSAWVLALVPLGLVALLSVASPDYLPVLLKNPIGHKLLYGAGILAVLGVLWIRRIIQIEV